MSCGSLGVAALRYGRRKAQTLAQDDKFSGVGALVVVGG
jgi:hypothetical protein